MAIKIGTAAFDLIMRYARKRLASPNAEGIMEVMSNKQAMDFVKDLIEEFNRFGVPESAITKVDDVGVIANEIMNIKQKQITEAFKKQMTPKKSAQVFDLQGNKIDTSKGIMAGRQIPETEAQIKTKIEKGNKEGIARLRQQKMVDGAIDNSSPGFSGDTKYDAQLVADDLAEKMYGKDFYDLDQKQQSDLYGQAYDGLAKQRFKGLKKPEPEDKAEGGRIGLKDGPEKPSRRKFLKIAGGLAALPIIGKFFKVAKVASKVPQVVTKPVAGKPAWFDSLVNKVIAEGDEVTKQFATKEREIVHIKKIDKDNTVTVTQDLDEGIVRVEYDSADNVFEETVQLQYKKPLPDEANPNPQAEFTTAESGPVGRQVGPDDYDMDIDEVGGSSIKDLDSDVSKLEEYATGKKPTMKEIVANKKRKDRAKQITDDPEAQSDAVIRRQGEMLDYDGPDDDFASGGIARMLGE